MFRSGIGDNFRLIIETEPGTNDLRVALYKILCINAQVLCVYCLDRYLAISTAYFRLLFCEASR